MTKQKFFESLLHEGLENIDKAIRELKTTAADFRRVNPNVSEEDALGWAAGPIAGKYGLGQQELLDACDKKKTKKK